MIFCCESVQPGLGCPWIMAFHHKKRSIDSPQVLGTVFNLSVVGWVNLGPNSVRSSERVAKLVLLRRSRSSIVIMLGVHLPANDPAHLDGHAAQGGRICVPGVFHLPFFSAVLSCCLAGFTRKRRQGRICPKLLRNRCQRAQRQKRRLRRRKLKRLP